MCGRKIYSKKQMLELAQLQKYQAPCNLLAKDAKEAVTGSVTVDGWSSVMGFPVLSMTRHYVDMS